MSRSHPQRAFRPMLAPAVLLGLFLACAAGFAQQQEREDLNVLSGWAQWSDGQEMLTRHLNRQAFALLDARDRELEGLRTSEDWLARRQRVREALERIVGPLPQRTPLNARVTGTVQKEKFRVEKVIFESLPGLTVTGCLFIPEGAAGPRPAILDVIGHTDIAFRARIYQNVILNLVDKGFVVLAIDPIGQGERLQYFDPDSGRSLVGGATAEHSYLGNQCFLAGVSPGRYFAWDGIRAIDYLLTRPEVDSTRIGVTGISGGGTQTSYIMALDPRVRAAAPTCYITGFRRLLESIGPQDAEQNLYHAVAAGITHADFLEVRAPRPTLLAATTRDFFSIQGARESFVEAKRAYRALGAEDQLLMSEDDLGHGFSRRNNEATYAFFQRALALPGDSTERELPYLTPEELQVTATGQLATAFPEGETVFSLNRQETLGLLNRLTSSRLQPQEHLAAVAQAARTLSGYRAPEGAPEAVFRGRWQREGYAVELYALEGEDRGYVIPLLLFVPAGRTGERRPALIWLSPRGKAADAAPGGRIEQLVRQGLVVAAADLIGTGETAPAGSQTAYAAMLIGRSIPGLQAGDVSRVAAWLRERPAVDPQRLGAVALGALGPALLHAAAFDPNLQAVVLMHGPLSYRSIALERRYAWPFEAMVAGALTGYDLPDLMGLVAPRKLLLVLPEGARGGPASQDETRLELDWPSRVYTARGDPGNFMLGTAFEANEARRRLGW